MDLLTDFPPGPLDYYRDRASFDWKKLKLFVYGEEALNYLHKLYEELKKYPEFHPVKRPLSIDEERYLTFKQTTIIRARQEELFPEKFAHLSNFFPDAMIKYGLTIGLFTRGIKDMGNERHAKFLEDANKGKISGCFCLTEVGHGSNVKGMRTRATYDKDTKEFIIDTPDFQAAKCWIGGLGNTATHALIYCQLYLENKNYGLHTFVVPIRDPDTLIAYAGVTVGDMGEKIALNGVDNGFILFKNYRIPRENLLNKNGDVTEDGRYVTPFTDDNKRFGASLLALSTTRVRVMIENATNGARALTIAVRYGAVRRQFGNENDETPILEYQTHQYRLLPYVAAVYVLQNVGWNISEIYKNYLQNPRGIGNVEFLGVELHIITSAAKPVSGWVIRDAIQSCREACGGHGYLKDAGLGNIRNGQDAALTYEGENWVLIQQAENFLIKLWENINAGVEITSPLRSVDFLNHALAVLEKEKFSPRTIEELCHPQSIFKIYQWLTCYLLRQTYERQAVLIKSGANKISAKNDTRVFYGRKLATAYIEHFFLQQFLENISRCQDLLLQPVLYNLFSLYGLFSLEKFLSVLYQGGYASGEQPTVLIQDAIVELLSKLKNDAVALVDVIALPDFILNSVLGSSDGQVYRHLENSFLTSPYGIKRPNWWSDIVNWKDIVPKPISKL